MVVLFATIWTLGYTLLVAVGNLILGYVIMKTIRRGPNRWQALVSRGTRDAGK